jgi:hypothetical protein
MKWKWKWGVPGGCINPSRGSTKKMADTKRLDWLEKEDCYSLISDDNGHWACVVEGIQSVSLKNGPTDITTTFWIKKTDWKSTIREAIDSAKLKQ